MINKWAAEVQRTGTALNAEKSEIVSLCERIIVICFTGSAKKLISRIAAYLGLTRNLRAFAYPFLALNAIDLCAGTLVLDGWPKDHFHRPLLSFISAIQYGYGVAVANQLRDSAFLELHLQRLQHDVRQSSLEFDLQTLLDSIIGGIFIHELSHAISKWLENKVSY